MKVKIFVYFLIVLFVAGCSQSRLVRRPEETPPLKLGCRFSVLDSSDAKNSGPESKLVSLRGDSLQAITMASQRKTERDMPFVARKKLVPFRERAQTFWTCVGACTLGGLVIGTAIGMAQEPEYRGEDSGWSTMKGMVYGTAIGCGVGVVVGALVAAKEDILMLGDEAGEIRWEK
ncbi:hypothetical protein L0337_24005 [candidate division KSB1 bacterium]|nr:hypothetical protein [candidate division KSB1 bacterium]